MPPDLRDDARALIVAALKSLDPARRVAAALADAPEMAAWSGDLAGDDSGRTHSPLDQRESGDTLLVAVGRSACAMAAGACAVLGEHITAGVVAYPSGARVPPLPAHLQLHQGSEGPSDSSTLVAGRAIEDLLAGASSADRVLVLLSEGAWGLAADPIQGIGFGELRATRATLERAGWASPEIEGVCGLLDGLRSGGLARLAHPARTLVVLLEDGDGTEVVGAPVLPRTWSPRDAEIALRRREAWSSIPASVRSEIVAAREGDTMDPPEVELIRAGGAKDLESTLRREAEGRGFTVQSLGDALRGDAATLGRALARAIGAAQDGGAPVPLPAVLLGRGEARAAGGPGAPAVQELTVAAALELQGRQDVLLAALDTTGSDGASDAAGGFADGTSAARAREAGTDLAALRVANQAERALETIGDRILTGPTGVDGGDLYLALIGGRGE